jgi:hypothetical protein
VTATQKLPDAHFLKYFFTVAVKFQIMDYSVGFLFCGISRCSILLLPNPFPISCAKKMVSYKPDKFYLVNDFFSWRTEISNL